MARGTTYETQPAGTYDWTAAYGGKPIVPDPTATAGSAISGNIANLPGITRLGTGVNAFNVGQMNTALGGLISGYPGLEAAQSGAISSQLAGNLSPGTIAMLAQGAAERGIGGGMTTSSPNVEAAYLRALGLTSEGQVQQGMQNLGSLTSRMGGLISPFLFNPSSMFVSPGEMQAADMARNLYASMPDPQAAMEAAIAAASPGRTNRQGTNWPMIMPSQAGGGPASAVAPLPWERNNIVGPLGYQEQGFVNEPEAAFTGGSGYPWYFDQTVGAYVNPLTGQISDRPNEQNAWSGFSWQGVNAPADNYS